MQKQPSTNDYPTWQQLREMPGAMHLPPYPGEQHRVHHQDQDQDTDDEVPHWGPIFGKHSKKMKDKPVDINRDDIAAERSTTLEKEALAGGKKYKSRRHSKKSRRHSKKSHRHSSKSRRHSKKSRRHSRK